MSDTIIRFTVPGLAPASFSGNSRTHWRKRHTDGDEYAERVYVAGRPFMHPENGRRDGWAWTPAKLTLTQYAIRLRDSDNFLASFKPGLDTLTTKGSRPLGFIWDDAPEHLSIEVRSQRVKHKADECVLVTIEKVI